MQTIPPNTLARFDDVLKQRNVPAFSRTGYRKWLRYFLDFRAKYPLPSERSVQVKLFSEKLRSKGQTSVQVEQATDAISLFFTIERKARAGFPSTKTDIAPSAGVQSVLAQRHGREAVVDHRTPSEKVSGITCGPHDSLPHHAFRRGRRYDNWRCLRSSGYDAWDEIIAKLADEIKTRHYSRKTLQHYANWTRKFQRYLAHKDPAQLSSEDVKRYLTYLAVNCKVSSSTQNLAFNALLFHPNNPGNARACGCPDDDDLYALRP